MDREQLVQWAKDTEARPPVNAPVCPVVARAAKAGRIIDAIRVAPDATKLMERILLRHEIDTLKEAADGHS